MVPVTQSADVSGWIRWEGGDTVVKYGEMRFFGFVYDMLPQFYMYLYIDLYGVMSRFDKFIVPNYDLVCENHLEDKQYIRKSTSIKPAFSWSLAQIWKSPYLEYLSWFQRKN